MRRNKPNRGRSKNYSDAVLVDIYGGLIKEENRETLMLYYNEDHSLAEVAENYGTTRQAVQQNISRSMAKLKKYDKSLRLVSMFNEIEKISYAMEDFAEREGAKEIAALAKKLQALIEN